MLQETGIEADSNVPQELWGWSVRMGQREQPWLAPPHMSSTGPIRAVRPEHSTELVLFFSEVETHHIRSSPLEYINHRMWNFPTNRPGLLLGSFQDEFLGIAQAIRSQEGMGPRVSDTVGMLQKLCLV